MGPGEQSPRHAAEPGIAEAADTVEGHMSEADRMVMVAISRYADSCPPSLHPDCPFAEGSLGDLSCERQCRTLVNNLVKASHHRKEGHRTSMSAE